ncbi:hypothetical protein GCM10029992_33860 [Glycomyces albus]
MTEVSGTGWRWEHRPAYEEALPWLARETTLIDTTDLTPEETAKRIAADVAE